MTDVHRASDFRYYLAARLVSIAGASASLVVVPVLVFDLTRSPLWVGFAAALGGVVYLLFAIPGGYVADRYTRSSLLIGTTLARAGLLALVPVLHYLGILTAPALLALLAGVAVLFVVSDAANAGTLRSLVGPDRLTAANAKIAGSAAVIEVVAPMLTGLVLASVTAPAFLVFEVVALAGSTVLLVRIRRQLDGTSSLLQGGIHARDLFGGFTFVWREAVVRWTSIAAFSQAFVEGLIVGQLVVYLGQAVPDHALGRALGVAYASIALGSLAGAFLVARLSFSDRPVVLSLLGLSISALLLFGLALSQPLWLSCILLGLWAVPFVVIFVGSASLRQALAPDALQGRVAVVGRLLTLGAGVPLGSILGGVITTTASVEANAYIGALLTILCFMFILVSRKRLS